MSIRRRICFLDIVQGEGNMALLAVQNLRNTQMVATSTASIALICSLALAALTNNAYNANHIFVKTAFFGEQSRKMFALKYGLAYFPLLFSLLCSSLAIGFMIDAIFLLNTSTEFSSSDIILLLYERGYLLAQIGKRLLSISFVLLLWLFGPVPVAFSSVALVWWLKDSDFVG
ncbi:uncharacterized protein LOC126796711 [Argentina anserina]|uniref:uncharacterized protein LOC126796711 n=1 Tax=Argentina anserina TaxID=57926 RepID=UPI00217643B7|nr:uncharacterized protein LOC126796711 [Potentilla anserina]